MASREKKILIGRKQSSASPVPPKEGTVVAEATKLTVTKTDIIEGDDVPSKVGTVKPASLKTNVKPIKNTTSLAKKLTKTVGRKAISKKLNLNIKGREKKPVPIKQKMAKTLLSNAKKNLDSKNTLLKNGIKPKRIRRKKIEIELAKALEDSGPPVLEPMYPIEPNTEKKPVKKRVKKVSVIDNAKKTKLENSNNYSSIDETINSILNQIVAEEEKKVTKKPKLKRPKIEPTEESIEDVMKDLTYLIKSEDIKKEIEVLEPVKTETIKPKRSYTRKPKVESLKKKTIKKENLENKLENITLDAQAKHLIDMLDLSVHKTDQLSLPICNRRHSIERCSISVVGDLINAPRIPTPRSKPVTRVRQSVDSTLSLRRNSPYSTRSDGPQLLRNGKHRKLKDSLLDGLEYKKRKRLCSDFSGSEKSISKFSGYESDGSFTDTASFHCSDNMDQKDEQSKLDFKKEIPFAIGPSEPNQIDTLENNENKISDEQALFTDSSGNGFVEDGIKSDNVMDNNSNLCNEILLEVPILAQNSEASSVHHENDNELPEISGQSICSKVPEKSIILDKMKETFNDINIEDQEKRASRLCLRRPTKSDDLEVSTSKFYGVKNDLENTVEDKEEASCDKTIEETVSNFEDLPPSQLIEEASNIDNCIESIATPIECNENNNTNLELTGSDEYVSNENLDVAIQEDSTENLSKKRDILEALGLQSLKAAEEVKLKERTVKNDYTGTLKTVIKLNRTDKKKGRNSFKMTLQKPKSKVKESETEPVVGDEEQRQKTMKDIASSSWRSHGAQSSDTAGALRKSHYFNRSNNMDGSSEHTSDGDVAAGESEDTGKVLVIPEKASSFSIHPGRLCKDECSYCFGKFGLFDTPCHIAQMKSIERQDKILQTEKHLTRDSCLCDACYRHVDRKSNTPSYLNKGSKRNNIVAPGPRQNHCHVLGCGVLATNILRRKWLIKMRKSVREVINIDLENPGLHSIPICSEHYNALEHLMVCAMCKRKLARNHIHYLGPEMNELNIALNEEGIPVKLIDKPVVCKLCRYFTSLVMKPIEERSQNTIQFFKEYKSRLLNFYEVEMVDEPAEETELVKVKDEKDTTKKKKKLQKATLNGEPPKLQLEQYDVDLDNKISNIPSDSNSLSKSRSESPSDYMIDYNTLIPSIAMDCESDVENSKRETSVVPFVKQAPSTESTIQEPTDVTKSTKSKSNVNSKTSAIAVQRLGSNPCISVRQLFPGEEEVGLQGHIEFGNVKEKTPEGWEKCSSVIQYDNDTKLLWQELQKPYGNQSSFLRHLILLEKYFRSGDLILSPNASHHSINYSESVQNRLRAYDNIPLNSSNSQANLSVRKSSSGIVTTKQFTPTMSIINAANIPKNTPITISQITSIAPSVSNKTRNPGVPPGLISLHPGTTRPVAPSLIKVPQPQKIKIPLTKNWRPNLIPIDPSKATDKDKKPGYVKVMSGGKPYHITMDDYNRMCAIKKSYDLKQKRLLEAQNVNSASLLNTTTSQPTSYLKPILPRKGLVISKSATITSPKSDQNLSDTSEVENSLEKLDRTVENLESKLTEPTTMLLPKIPKSLTVIPQTVTHRPSQLSSPKFIMSKPKPAITNS